MSTVQEIESDDDVDFDFESEDDMRTSELEAAINKFLDEVNRPVGSMSFDVPKSPAVDRAILGLFDVVNRNL